MARDALVSARNRNLISTYGNYCKEAVGATERLHKTLRDTGPATLAIRKSGKFCAFRMSTALRIFASHSRRGTGVDGGSTTVRYRGSL